MTHDQRLSLVLSLHEATEHLRYCEVDLEDARKELKAAILREDAAREALDRVDHPENYCSHCGFHNINCWCGH